MDSWGNWASGSEDVSKCHRATKWQCCAPHVLVWDVPYRQAPFPSNSPSHCPRSRPGPSGLTFHKCSFSLELPASLFLSVANPELTYPSCPIKYHLKAKLSNCPREGLIIPSSGFLQHFLYILITAINKQAINGSMCISLPPNRFYQIVLTFCILVAHVL